MIIRNQIQLANGSDFSFNAGQSGADRGFGITKRRAHAVTSKSSDDQLVSMINFLNKQQDAFHDWDSDISKSKLLTVLVPWLLKEPPHPIKSRKAKPLQQPGFDCMNPKFANTLSGEALKPHRLLVDFVPFGYDVDKLEIRFYELYNVIDAFVIYESPITQTGVVKPMIYHAIRNSTRFGKWQDKVIYLQGTLEELDKFRQDTDSWSLEHSMRTEMIRKFKEVDDSASLLKRHIMKNIDKVYATQNDADEIPSGEALLHIKYCKLKPDVFSIYLPTISFKSNFHWIQRTSDMQCILGASVSETTSELKSYLWRLGPFMWPLQEFILHGNTRRNEFKNSPDWCKHHMGLGSGVHISSVSDPIEFIFKLVSVCDDVNKLSREFVHAGQEGKISLDILVRNTMIPWCSHDHPVHHVTTLNTIESRNIVWSAIPWIVRYNPSRYPFILPSPLLEDLRSDNPTIDDEDDDMEVSTAVGIVRASSSSKEIMKTGFIEWTRWCPLKTCYLGKAYYWLSDKIYSLLI